MISVFKNEVALVEAKNPASDQHKTVLLSFTGIGHEMGAIDVQQIEFFGAGRAFDNVIFISDLTRSWGNALDFVAIAEALKPYLEGRRVYSIGNSMGGFLSVVATNFISIEASVSFVPQFSVSKTFVPTEKRWKKYTSKIADFKIPSLADQFGNSTRYYLFSGSFGADRKHWKQFPKQDNIQNIVLRWTEHDVAPKLKKWGVLTDLIMACFEDEFSPQWMKEKLGWWAQKV